MTGEEPERPGPLPLAAGRSVHRPQQHVRNRVGSLLLLVMLTLPLVHWLAPPLSVRPEEKPASGAAKHEPQPAGPFTGELPANVAEMRDALLAATHSGSMDDLRTAIEWNELRPDFGESAGSDPIAFLKHASADGEGREILAVLANILALAPAETRVGKDPENNAVYVWPYLAELPLDKLTPAQEVDLYRLVPPALAKTIRAKKKWTWWRLAIGADGTWHTFRKYD